MTIRQRVLLAAAVVFWGATGGAAEAGPISFTLNSDIILYDPGHPIIAASLFSTIPTGPRIFDATAQQNKPLDLSFLAGRPPAGQLDPSIAPHGDGTYWETAAFRATVHVTDTASGASGNVTFNGEAHGFYTATGGKWVGDVYLWMDSGANGQTLLLGGNKYEFWVPRAPVYDSSVSLGVWVGDGGPAFAAPEPGTLALAAIGLAPVGCAALRRRRK